MESSFLAGPPLRSLQIHKRITILRVRLKKGCVLSDGGGGLPMHCPSCDSKVVKTHQRREGEGGRRGSEDGGGRSTRCIGDQPSKQC